MKYLHLLSIVFAILMLFSFSSALSLERTEISVNVNDKGNASFKESYIMRLSPVDIDRLSEKLEENGKNLQLWKSDYSFFFPHFSDIAEMKNINVTFDSEGHVLLLEYSRDRSFSKKISEQTRSTAWTVEDLQFEKFVVGTTISIPKNTQIKISLPQNVQINNAKISPEISASENNLFIQGFQGSNLFIEYDLIKPIAPPINTDQLIQNFLSNSFQQIFAGLLVVLAFFIYAFRAPIVKKVEDFIIDNSELEYEMKNDEEFELE